MGRKSVLTPEQWVEIERRHLVDGESLNSLAREFGVNESSLRRKIKPNKAESPNTPNPLQQLAVEKAANEKEAKDIADRIAVLPIAKQQIVTDLSAKLRSVSDHLACAAEYGAMTAHRLAGIANQQIQKVNDADPLAGDSVEILKGVGALTTLANQSAQLGMNLLQANKEAAGGGNGGLNDKLSELIEKLPG